MKAAPFLLIGVTDDSPISQDISLLETLLADGLDLIYWRSPVDDGRINQLPRSLQASVLIPGKAPGDVLSPFRRHLKEADRRRLPARERLSFSTSIHQLDEWPLLAGQVDMVFYSPVFPSISKPGYGPTISLDTIRRQVQTLREQHKPLPLLIGLGGVTAGNVALLRQAGFDGAALMGSLWQTPDPRVALTAIREALRRQAS